MALKLDTSIKLTGLGRAGRPLLKPEECPHRGSSEGPRWVVGNADDRCLYREQQLPKPLPLRRSPSGGGCGDKNSERSNRYSSGRCQQHVAES